MIGKAYEIANELVSVKILEVGAELTSIVEKKTGKELLWQGDEKIWSGQSPNLFPLIGRLKDETYTISGQRYQIGIHGFAKYMAFSVSEYSGDSITFMLESNADTYAKYPFAFNLLIKYTLTGKTLKKDFTVINRSDCDMYYEVGGHEGYNLALFDGEKMDDYYLRFPNRKDKLDTYTCDENVMLNQSTKEIGLDNGRLNISMELFRNDALILRDTGGQVELCSVKNGRLLSLDFSDFEYLGIWTMNLEYDTNYVCLEPWSSLPDCNFLGYELEKKIGIRLLPPNGEQTSGYVISILM